MKASTAPNTIKAYNTGLHSFESFRVSQNRNLSWPPSMQEIVLFVAQLSLRHCSFRTAELYVAAISFKCKTMGVTDTTKHFIVGKALEGLKRTAKQKRARLPITLDILNGILTTLSAVCRNTYECALFSAAFNLAFFGFFRVGELTAVKKGSREVDKIVGIQDISWAEGGKSLSVRIRFSKVDQVGKGSSVQLAKTGHPLVCPVLATSRFLAIRPKFQGPLLCHNDGSPLTRYQFSAILRRAVGIFNPELTAYTSHSFRLGAASSAAKWGWSVEQIKQSGRWASNTYRLYVHKV